MKLSKSATAKIMGASFIGTIGFLAGMDHYNKLGDPLTYDVPVVLEIQETYEKKEALIQEIPNYCLPTSPNQKEISNECFTVAAEYSSLDEKITELEESSEYAQIVAESKSDLYKNLSSVCAIGYLVSVISLLSSWGYFLIRHDPFALKKEEE